MFVAADPLLAASTLRTPPAVCAATNSYSVPSKDVDESCLFVVEGVVPPSLRRRSRRLGRGPRCALHSKRLCLPWPWVFHWLQSMSSSSDKMVAAATRPGATLAKGMSLPHRLLPALRCQSLMHCACLRRNLRNFSLRDVVHCACLSS